MRHYRYEATERTLDALRLLRRAWLDFVSEPEAVTVRLRDGGAVRVGVDRADVEEGFEVIRLVASEVEPPGSDGREASALALGGNDVVLFAGATWMNEAENRDGQIIQFSGHPGQIPEDADAVCITSDAVVVASSVGTGVLVRVGVRPGTIELTEDREEIARFVTGRGYK
jgi:hypothetical protein